MNICELFFKNLLKKAFKRYTNTRVSRELIKCRIFLGILVVKKSFFGEKLDKKQFIDKRKDMLWVLRYDIAKY